MSTFPYCLSFDLTSQEGQCALLDSQGEEVAIANFKESSAEGLFELLDTLLRKGNAGVENIAEILLPLGPSRYTQLRTLYAIAKAWASSHPIRVASVHSAFVHASRHLSQESQWCTGTLSGCVGVAYAVSPRVLFYEVFERRGGSELTCSQVGTVSSMNALPPTDGWLCDRQEGGAKGPQLQPKLGGIIPLRADALLVARHKQSVLATRWLKDNQELIALKPRYGGVPLN